MSIKLAIVGATGLVGERLLKILAEEGVQPAALGLYASASSRGAQIQWQGQTYTVRALTDCDFSQYDAAFFCVGDELSAAFVPQALDAGCSVVDKSNAFRMAADVPLVVAGVNDDAVSAETRLVANPNCSTIVLTHALAPLAERFGLARVWAATYQSVSGAGKGGVSALHAQIAGTTVADDLSDHDRLDSAGFAFNVVPSIGSLDAEGRCSEETKLVQETRKILSLPELSVVAHAARVPVYIGHSIAVTVELTSHTDEVLMHDALRSSAYLKLIETGLPTPLGSSRHDKVEVGRLRSEDGTGHLWSMFLSADNLRLGAALNGWRIMQLMQAKRTIGKVAARS